VAPRILVQPLALGEQGILEVPTFASHYKVPMDLERYLIVFTGEVNLFDPYFLELREVDIKLFNTT